MDNLCYKYDKIMYNDKLFNNIDATYIIHLVGINKRLEHVKDQLLLYHPSNIVYIVNNKGYKNCKKKKFIINSVYDIIDCNLDIFNHAKKMNYNNILILEDDFTFNSNIKNETNNIDNFLNKHKNMSFQYYLGCLPLIMIPYDKYTYINKSIGTHSVIYSKKMRNEILLKKQEDIADWDLYNNFYNNRYTYYKPLCYQIFSETENSEKWGANILYFNKLNVLTVEIIKKILKYNKLNRYSEPGFTNFYLFAKLFYYFLIIIIILIGLYYNSYYYNL